jgi:diguanylate cyclase (GGDEF)-like protein
MSRTLLPKEPAVGSSALESPQFLLLITVVGLNTLLYVGLTLSKLIPWPKQFRPAAVRRLMQRTHLSIDEESAVAQIQTDLGSEGDSGFNRLRYGAVRTGVPQAMVLAGGVIMLFAFLEWFSDVAELAWNVAAFLLGFAVMLIGIGLWYGRVRAPTMQWVHAITAVLVVNYFFADAAVNGVLEPVIYAVIFVTAYSPVLLAWSPALWSGAGIVLGGLGWSIAYEATSLLLVAVTVPALISGYALLDVRLRGLRLRAGEIERSTAIATTDIVSGALTQRGLQTLAPGMGAIAERTDQPIYVASVDITRLRDAHEAYGKAYSDALLRTTAEAIGREVRGGDLVARWEGDEFVVLGIGDRPEDDDFRLRIEDAIRDTGVALGRWPVEVSVGSAAGDSTSTTFTDLLAGARTARAARRAMS